MPFHLTFGYIRCLLVIAEEDLDGQPRITTDLEPLRQRVNRLHLLVSQLPAINLKVSLDARRSHRLGNHTGSTLKTPHEEHLLYRLALLLSQLLERLVLVERRVGGAEAGVCRGVDVLLLEVVDELGGGVVGVQLDLVNGGGDLEGVGGEELVEVLDGEVGDANVLDAARFRQLLHLGPGVAEVPIGVVLL